MPRTYICMHFIERIYMYTCISNIQCAIHLSLIIRNCQWCYTYLLYNTYGFSTRYLSLNLYTTDLWLRGILVHNWSVYRTNFLIPIDYISSFKYIKRNNMYILFLLIYKTIIKSAPSITIFLTIRSSFKL